MKEDQLPQFTFMKLWQKALEFNLKGTIYVQAQEIHAELVGTESTVIEFMHIVQVHATDDKITMSMKKTESHYSTLTSNIV